MERQKKSKSKYRKGGPVLSLDELARQEYVFFYDKVFHMSWFGNWQLRWCEAQIKRGAIRYAIKEESDEVEKQDPVG